MDKIEEKYKFRKKLIFYLTLVIILIFTSVIYEYWIHKKSSPNNITASFQEDFIDAEILLSGIIDSLSKPNYVNAPLLIDSFINQHSTSPYAFFIFTYNNNKLNYWSDNAVPIPDIYEYDDHGSGILSLSNGIYFYRDTLIGQERLLGLFLIKRNYPYQNIYLDNRFQDAFSVPADADIAGMVGDHNIYNANREFLFSIDLDISYPPSTASSYILLLLYALIFITINAAIFQLYQLYRKYFKSKVLMIIAFAADVVILRLIMFFFQFPAGLYKTEIFSPASFAVNDYIPSMGDFFFNALTLLVIAYVLFITFNNVGLHQKKSKLRRYFLTYSLFLHIFIFYGIFLMAAESLILDSTFSLNLNQIFFLSADSFLALGVFTILLFSFFLITFRILGLAHFHSGGKSASYFLFLFFTTALYVIICVFFKSTCNLWLFVPLIVYAIAFYFLSNPGSGNSEIRFTSVILYLFLFSFLSTAILDYYNNQKEAEQRKLLAIELSSGEDPLTEYIFLSACEEMRGDSRLMELLSMAPYDLISEDLAANYIQDNYLSDRLRKYEWMITICTPYRSLIIQPAGYEVNCYTYFNDIINTLGSPGLGEELYRYDNEAGMCNYISSQEYFFNDSADTITVFIELFSFFIPEEGLGYPELLIDEKIKTFSGLENYSYARYKDGNLVFKYGDYPYRTNISIYNQENTDSFFVHNKSDHFISKIDENEFLILTKNETGLLGIIAPFSYLLIFFALFILAFFFCVNIPLRRTHFELNFRNRLQLYIISLILISFVIVGNIMVRYVINLNTDKNREILQEKTHSVLIELEHKLADREQLTPDMEEYLTTYLIKFSKVFFSDINLYDLKGNLLASSRPQIFQKELISTRMNTDAFRVLTIDKKLLYIHTETIGDQDYFSAYVPFMNADNKVVAYLNLPYFARQTELQNEISVFLNAFLNVYVLMIAAAILIALLISRYTTRPLQLISDKMGSLSLDGTNEKIKWSRNDEIGTLVSEYNRMIDELSTSAELLAKSERESAWREMAKQVAHEIKNPLTPMKLSVQYLQKAWDEKSPDWDERLRRFTQTIVQHIDTLSDIASEFSDFAKMPQKKEEKVELSTTISKSLDLFSDIENIQFDYSSSVEPACVLADKNQLIRVFNNLIQNSVQAIGQEKNGQITISLDQEEEMYSIRVADNGPGIAEEMMEKIFSPSFTTKSGGMGLGLALVKSIILEAGGDISFESSPETGTVFLIRLPVCKE